MVEELKDALVMLKQIVFCEQGEGFIVAGAGTLAMEMALLNTVRQDERFLVLSQGYFGQRMSEIGRSFGIDHDILQSPWGEVIAPEKLEEQLAGRDYAAVVSTHVDTATGACAPVEAYADILKDSGCLYLIDGVCATGGIEERMTDWGVDVILTAAQKCFGTPPGLAVLVFSEAAMAKRRSMTSIPAYYSDLLRWLPIMKDPAKYFSTPCVNEIRAFAEACRIMMEEGMEERFHRHAKIAEAFRSALLALGFRTFTRDDCLAETLSVMLYPPGVEDSAFRSTLAGKGVIVAGGLGEVAGRVFRMGHMGNLSFSQVEFSVAALEDTLDALGYGFEARVGTNAAKKALRD
jgi:aspartate aminotransferase-like enzyme